MMGPSKNHSTRVSITVTTRNKRRQRRRHRTDAPHNWLAASTLHSVRVHHRRLCILTRAPCGGRLYYMLCIVSGASSTRLAQPSVSMFTWNFVLRSCESEFKFEGTIWLKHKRFWFVFWEVPHFNLGRDTDYSKDLSEFPQSLQVNVGIAR